MKVSFLVICYDQEKYITNILDSILNIEKPCDWECLISDDGASDGTVSVIKKYMERYPQNIFLYENERDAGKKYDAEKRITMRIGSVSLKKSYRHFKALQQCSTGSIWMQGC